MADRIAIGHVKHEGIPFEPVIMHSGALVQAIEQYEDATGDSLNELQFARALITYQEACGEDS